tara:strand:- start:1986 stop:2207 length:222 start_codon:yes stop_codon:yes gene_type:complete
VGEVNECLDGYFRGGRMKHIEISIMEDGELSIDGQVKPAGNLDIREFEDGEWVGGCYATYENLVDKVKECLEE